MWEYNHFDELYHHGIKGQKRGVRRFQNKDGSLTPAGRERYGNKSGSSSGGGKQESVRAKLRKSVAAYKQKKADKAKAEEEEKKRKEAEEHEAAKQKAIKSGTAEEVLSYKGELTSEQMKSALERIRWEKDIRDLDKNMISEGQANADKFFNSIDKATQYAVTGIKAYNLAANIANAVGGKNLPTIDVNNTSSNKDSILKRKRDAQDYNDKKKAEKKKAESDDRDNKTRSEKLEAERDKLRYEAEVSKARADEAREQATAAREARERQAKADTPSLILPPDYDRKKKS